MDTFIKDIRVTNFKSLKDCEINNCKRINLFIGRPNVGKSNILEALSIFSLPVILDDHTLLFTDFVRIEHENELFFNGDISLSVSLKTNLEHFDINYDPKNGLNIYISDSNSTITVSEDFRISGGTKLNPPFETIIKKYIFKSNLKHKKGHSKFLVPPYGKNLFSIIENYKTLKDEVGELYAESNLKVILDRTSGTLKIIHNDKDNIAFLLPYSSIADTLQRIIFYKAAIESNENSVLLFEEPEAHAYPPFISKITQDIITKKSNQYFITTHSPVILNDFLENAQDELAVYIVKFEDQQTKVRALSKRELEEVSEYGVDLFTNSETYI